MSLTPRRRRRRPTRPRCAFELEGRRCRAAGEGNPPLCRLHREPSQVERAVDNALAGLVGVGVGYVVARAQEFLRPAPAPAAAAALDPRELLGFAPAQVLDRVRIEQRRRQLALEYHPDRGHDGRMLARINAAADQLLREVGA